MPYFCSLISRISTFMKKSFRKNLKELLFGPKGSHIVISKASKIKLKTLSEIIKLPFAGYIFVFFWGGGRNFSLLNKTFYSFLWKTKCTIKKASKALPLTSMLLIS